MQIQQKQLTSNSNLLSSSRPKRRGISLSSKISNINQDNYKPIITSIPQLYNQTNNTCYQKHFQSPKQPQQTNQIDNNTINITTPNTVYYVQSKQNVSFSYSQATNNKNNQSSRVNNYHINNQQQLSQSQLLDKKILQLQNQIHQKNTILHQIKSTNRASPQKIQVTQKKNCQNNNTIQYSNVRQFNSYNQSAPTNNYQHYSNNNYNYIKQNHQVSKFQPIQISPIPVSSQINPLKYEKHQNKFTNYKQNNANLHQNSQITIVNHQQSTYPNAYKISPQIHKQTQSIKKQLKREIKQFKQVKQVNEMKKFNESKQVNQTQQVKYIKKNKELQEINHLSPNSIIKDRQNSISLKKQIQNINNTKNTIDNKPKSNKKQANKSQIQKSPSKNSNKNTNFYNNSLNLKVQDIQKENIKKISDYDKINKLRAMQSKLLNIIKVCEHGL